MVGNLSKKMYFESLLKIIRKVLIPCKPYVPTRYDWIGLILFPIDFVYQSEVCHCNNYINRYPISCG